MKKILLGMAAITVAAAASAQVEVGLMDAENLLNVVATPGVSDDGKETKVLASGTVLAQTASVTMVYPNGDAITKQNSAFNGIKTLVVNSTEVALGDGIGGTNNGKGDLNGPQSGCMYQFDVKKDGWLIVPSKISSNKPFYVFEGLQGADPIALAYTLGMDIQSGDYPDIKEVKYTLPADADGYVDREAADIDTYTFGTDAIGWPIRIATQDAEAASAGNGSGALVFPVYAEAEHYLVMATGSKMNTCGFVFVESDPAGAAPNVAVKGVYKDTENEKVIVITGSYDPGAVNAVEATLDVNAPIYNAQGVRVNADAKGLLIQNGKKFIRK